VRKEFERQLAGVQEGVERRKNGRILDEFLTDLHRSPGGKAAAAVGKAMGTFGGNADFIARSMGGGSIPKQQLVEQKKANELHRESLKLLTDLVQKDGFVVT
jgi:hypothetical protein